MECDSLSVQLRDGTNACLDPLIWQCFPLLDDSTRTAERELWVILFGGSSSLFLSHFRTTASSLLPASLHSCPSPAQRWLSPRALPASCDHCCSQESSLWAHQVPAPSLWPEREDRLVGVWIQFPAHAGNLADHSVRNRELAFFCHILPVGTVSLFPQHRQSAESMSTCVEHLP